MRELQLHDFGGADVKHWEEIGDWDFPYRHDKDTIFDGEKWWSIWEVEKDVFAPTEHYDWESGFGKSKGYLREIYQFCPLYHSLTEAKHYIIDASTGTESLVLSPEKMNRLRYLNSQYSRRNGIINAAEMEGRSIDLTLYHEERGEIALWITGIVQAHIDYTHAEPMPQLDWPEWKAQVMADNEELMVAFDAWVKRSELFDG